MVNQFFNNSFSSGYYTILGVFDTLVVTTYSNIINFTYHDNCDLEGFRHHIWIVN